MSSTEGVTIGSDLSPPVDVRRFRVIGRRGRCCCCDRDVSLGRVRPAHDTVRRTTMQRGGVVTSGKV